MTVEAQVKVSLLKLALVVLAAAIVVSGVYLTAQAVMEYDQHMLVTIQGGFLPENRWLEAVGPIVGYHLLALCVPVLILFLMSDGPKGGNRKMR